MVCAMILIVMKMIPIVVMIVTVMTKLYSEVDSYSTVQYSTVQYSTVQFSTAFCKLQLEK